MQCYDVVLVIDDQNQSTRRRIPPQIATLAEPMLAGIRQTVVDGLVNICLVLLLHQAHRPESAHIVCGVGWPATYYHCGALTQVIITLSNAACTIWS
jgi:hypothetical protein